MKLIFRCFILILLQLNTSACSPPQVPDKVITFEKVLEVPGSATSIIQKKDGGYFICASSSITKGDIILVEIDYLGNVLTSKKIYDSGGNDQAWKIENDYHGGYYLASHNGTKLNVIKIDSIGNIILNLNYTFTFTSQYDLKRGYDFCASSDGGFIFVWRQAWESLNWKKCNRKGEITHAGMLQYTSGNELSCGAIKQTNDNGFIIAGLATEIPYSLKERYGTFLIKLYPDGKINWDKSVENQSFLVRDILETLIGEYLILYKPSNFNNSDFGLVFSQSSGKISKHPSTWGSSGYDEPERIIIGNNDTYTGCGAFFNSPDNYDAYLFNLDQNGKFSWGKHFKGTGKGDQYASDVKLCTDGGYIIVGTDYSNSPDGKIYLIKTDKNGEVR